MKVNWAPLTTTSLAETMTVNALVTGLIVFRILTVFLEVKTGSTSVERTLDSTGGTKLRHIIFVIIESGMMLLVIQLLGLVFWVRAPLTANDSVTIALDYLVVITEMFNVIIRSVLFFSISFVLLKILPG